MIPGFKHHVWSNDYLPLWQDLYDSMEASNIDIEWVMPSSVISGGIQYEHFKSIPSSFSWYSPPTNIYDGQPYILRLRRLHYKHAYSDKYLVFPAHMECAIPRQSDKGQWNLPDSMVLSATLDYIENELGIPYLWTNGNVGEQYLRKMHQDIKTHIRTFDSRQVEAFKEVLHGAMDRPVWRRLRLTDSKPAIWDLAGKFIVGYDKNGQYIGASNSAYLGNGTFVMGNVDQYHPDFSGFWQYEITDVSDTEFDGYGLPCPLDVNRKWASTALINAARDVGVGVTVHKGIIWEQQGRYLQKWASNLWQHRVNLRDLEKYPNAIARGNAERTMKAIPNSMVGRFMNEYSKEYYHPDWQLGIVHQAIASQVYSMRYWLQNYDAKPVLVNKDAVYFLCNEPELFADIDRYSGELRGFKRIGVAPLNDTIIQAFSDEKSTNMLEILIKKEMKECEQSYL